MSGFQASISLLTKCENVLIYFPNEPHFDDFINVPFMIKIMWWGFFKMLCISPDSETSFTGICSFSAELGRISLCVTGITSGGGHMTKLAFLNYLICASHTSQLFLTPQDCSEG